MNLSILHISDLHRDSRNPIRNDVLLDCLEVDRRHYTAEETPAVRSPDLIIVSGDIIQGIRADEPDPDKRLREQYQEALDLLGRLTDRFVGGDRERVVIVPGNHDVSAYHFQQSLQRVDILPDRKKELVTQLFASGSTLRWSWSGFDLYEIEDQATYAQRLAAFAEFYATFYNGRRTYGLDASTQFDLFDLPRYDLTIVGFSSCHNNDLYNRQGAIHPACIAAAASALRHPSLRGRLRAAVWHHNIEGAPLQSDYMDPDLVQSLIDREFSLGFHGHQHRPQFLDTRFRYGKERGITIISAGTLCGSASFRYGRAYNIVELDTRAMTGRLHVRDMQNDNLSMPIWGRRALPPDAAPYYEFRYDPPPVAAGGANAGTVALVEAEARMEAEDWNGAVAILAPVVTTEELARPLLLECYLKLRNTTAIIATFDPPASEAEVIHVMDALWGEGMRGRLRELLNLPMVVNSGDPSVKEMRSKYGARLNQ